MAEDRKSDEHQSGGAAERRRERRELNRKFNEEGRSPKKHQSRSEQDKKGEDLKSSKVRRIVTAIIGLVFISLLAFWLFNPGGFTPIKTSEGIAVLEEKSTERIQMTEGAQLVQVWLTDEFKPTDAEGKEMKPTKQVQFQYVFAQAQQIKELVEKAEPKNGYNSVVPQESLIATLAQLFLPILLLVALFVWLFPKLQSGMMQFGRVKNDGFTSDLPDVNFQDVAGVDEAVEELREIKEFLDTPEKFHKMGAKIPKGVLLYGPPGTGKTLLARAVAGEAGVPFFHISASEFVEMFVGVGASRVRDLFTKAKKVAPAIVFVDEIDAVGRNRGSGIGGGNDEREQTLNQLLVEMDGFDERTNVIVIAATNRPDVLDPALLRPGRFDRQIAVDAPDLPGRQQILEVHAKGKPLAPGVELDSIARRTPGFSGADLANLLNEAALLAARREHEQVTEDDIDEAIDRVIAGPQRRTRVMNDADKLMTAYHEGGHAVVAAASNYSDPVTKVTILPRGRALGYTMVMPVEDRYSTSRNELLDQLSYAMGGRIAEEIVFHDPSTGASNDIQKATNTARKMVTEYGMSSRVGAVRFSADESDPMTRMGGGSSRTYSEDTARLIDDEVQQLMENASQEAWQILNDNRDVLDTLAARLLEKETVLEAELKEIFAGIRKAPKREQWLSAETRPISTLPPVVVPSPAAGATDGAGATDEGAGATDGADVTPEEEANHE